MPQIWMTYGEIAGLLGCDEGVARTRAAIRSLDRGGRAVIVGTLIGAVIVGVLRNGLSLAGVQDLYQTLAVGIMVISAVSLDQWIRRVGK